jgi:Ssp1 endopeptidase immunity protein Rap1a
MLTLETNMRFVIAVLLPIVAGIFAGTATADPMTVGQLVARCGKLDMSEPNQIKMRSASIGDALDAGKCWGHLEAYMDLASVEFLDASNPNAVHPLGVCPPYQNNISFPELEQMFIEYASNNPADLKKPAALIIPKILAQKFPCRK